MGLSASDFEKQLNDFRLTTAEILYHMPDAFHLLQSFIWQKLDKAPEFPAGAFCSLGSGRIAKSA